MTPRPTSATTPGRPRGGSEPRLVREFEEIDAMDVGRDWVLVKTYRGNGAWTTRARINNGSVKVPGGADAWELSVSMTETGESELWARRRQ